MELRYTKNAKLLFLTLLGTVLASFSYLIYIYNPLESIIDKVTGFYPNSIVFSLWKEPPYGTLIKVYIFNVTNSEAFLDGNEKLKFNEVGPYVYKETLYNINSTFNDNGTVSFTPKRNVVFMPEYSIGDPNVDTLLMPNIPLLGITAALKDGSMFAKLGVASVSAYLGSKPFINITITDFLYGYDDPLVTLANDYLPNWIDFPRFGILDRIMVLDNGSSIVTMNVNPEIKMSDNTLLTKEERLQQFSIQNWNGSPGFSQWGYQLPEGNETRPQNSKCNLVEGAFMGTLFPHNIKKNATFNLYRHAFCRTIPIEFEKSKMTKDGFEGYTFRVKQDFLATTEENPNNDCFCTTADCVPKGLADLSPCYYSIPIAMSQPHFLNADPTLLEDIEGLSPDRVKHDTTMTIHPRIGLPLEASLRVQINLVMPTTQYNSATRPFNNLALPLFWVDVGVDNIPAIVTFYINLLYHVLPTVQEVLMYVFAVAAVVLIFGSALIIVLYPTNTKHETQKSLHINYSQIPVFTLKSKLFKPDILIEK